MHFVHRFLVGAECLIDLVQLNGAVIVRCAKFEGFWVWRSGAVCRDVRFDACDACRVCRCCDLFGSPPPGCFQFPSLFVGGRVALLPGAPCGLVVLGAQAAAVATVAVFFSVDASGSTLIMPSEGCVAGAVAGSSRSLSSWSVLDAGATAVVPVMSVAAAAKHEAASVLKQVRMAWQKHVVLQRRQPRFSACTLSVKVRSLSVLLF